MNEYRNMAKYRIAASSLEHVALVPEVQHALEAWVTANKELSRGVLIGGLAMSFYTKPRYTEDVDILFLSVKDIPETVAGFKRYRPGAFEENKTQVSIEVVTPASFTLMPDAVADKVFRSAVAFGNLKVASREGMIALKLCSAQDKRRKLKDLADVVELLDVDLSLVEALYRSLRAWPINDAAKLLLDEAFKTVFFF